MVFLKLIYLFWLRALSSCSEWEPFRLGVRGLLTVVASLFAEHGLQAPGFRSCGAQAPERRPSICGTQAQLLRGMWDPPGPGLEPVCPALASRFSTTAPPGKPLQCYLETLVCLLLLKSSWGNSLAVQRLGLHASTAGGPGSIPGRGTKIRQAFWSDQKKKKKSSWISLDQIWMKTFYWDFPGGAVVNNPPANAGDTGSSPGLGRSHMLWSN